MFESLTPIQQVLIGIAGIGALFTLLVVYLSQSSRFSNVDRLEGTFDSDK